MRKKIFSLAFTMVLGASLLSGCGRMKIVFEDDTEAVTQEQTEDVSQEETPSEEEADAEEEMDATTKADLDTDSGSSDVTPVEASLENPAKIGEWVETKSYSAQDQQYHTMYYKITSIIRGEEAQKIVDAYNAEDHVIVINELEQDELEYCIVTYETYFPSDFPEADYGITSVDVDLSVCNLKDSGAIDNYIGLSSVWDISDSPDINEFYAGDTFKDGQAVFAMVKDFGEYLIKCSYYDNDTTVTTYVTAQ